MNSELGNFNALRHQTLEYDKVPGHLSPSVSKSGLVLFGSKNCSLSNFSHKSILVKKYLKQTWFSEILKNEFFSGGISSVLKGLVLTAPTIINGKEFIFEQFLFLFRIFRSILYEKKSLTFFFFNGSDTEN